MARATKRWGTAFIGFASGCLLAMLALSGLMSSCFQGPAIDVLPAATVSPAVVSPSIIPPPPSPITGAPYYNDRWNVDAFTEFARASGDAVVDAVDAQGAIACGNGRLDPGEECDDGGRLSGDGCDRYCWFESNYRISHPIPIPSSEGTGRSADGLNGRGDGDRSDAIHEVVNVTSWNHDARLFQRMLYQLQNPRNCSTAQFIVWAGGSDCGWGCYLHLHAEGLANAFASGRAYIIAPHSVWNGTLSELIYSRSEECLSSGNYGTWECFFLPLSSTCDVSNIGDQGVPRSVDGRMLSSELPGFDINKFPNIPRVTRHETGGQWMMSKTIVHPQFAHRGVLWFRAQIEQYLLRPRRWVAVAVEQERQRLRMPRLTVGLHVRRSDKGKESPLIPNERYYSEVDRWYQYTKSKNMFISTEDDATLQAFIARYPDWNIHYTNNERRNEILTYENYGFNATEQTLIAVKNLALLSDTDYQIVTWSSNYGRAVYEVTEMRTAGHSRVKSLDVQEWYLQP